MEIWRVSLMKIRKAAEHDPPGGSFKAEMYLARIMYFVHKE
jgi:hypothetical protein